MKRTLVLVVDRDDDYGVKGKVNTPVIGVQDCLDAATAFGIADPEDSDLNALYAAVSTCLELQEAGQDANVALICGDEKVGYRSDLALVAQLEEVMDEVQPDSVVLVGDGAELSFRALTQEGLPCLLAPENIRMQSAWGVAMAALDKKPGTADELLPVYLRLSQAERERQEKLKLNQEKP